MEFVDETDEAFDVVMAATGVRVLNTNSKVNSPVATEPTVCPLSDIVRM